MREWDGCSPFKFVVDKGVDIFPDPSKSSAIDISQLTVADCEKAGMWERP